MKFTFGANSNVINSFVRIQKADTQSQSHDQTIFFIEMVRPQPVFHRNGTQNTNFFIELVHSEELSTGAEKNSCRMVETSFFIEMVHPATPTLIFITL